MLKDNTLRHWGRLVSLFDTFGTSPYTWDSKKCELRLKYSERNERLFHLLSISNCLIYVSFLICNLLIMTHRSKKVDLLEVVCAFNYLGLYSWGLVTSLNTAFSRRGAPRFLRGVKMFDKGLAGKLYNNLL